MCILKMVKKQNIKKTSLITLGYILIVGFFISVISIFVGIMLYEMFGDYGINTISDIALDLYNDDYISMNMHNFIIEKNNAYKNLNFYPDLLTLFSVSLFYIYALGVAIVSRKQRNVEFFTNLTIINMILTSLMSIMAQVLEWFYSEIMIKVLYNLNYNLYFTQFIVYHASEIFLFMFLSLVFVNKIEFFGKRKKESYTYEELEEDLIESEEVSLE